MPYSINPFTGELDYYKDFTLTYFADTGFAQAIDKELYFKGNKGVVTSADEATLTFMLDDSIARFFKTDDDQLTVAVEGILTVHGDSPIHTKANVTGQYDIYIDNATKESVGAAKFSAPYLVVQDGDVSILDATYSTKGISQFDQETFIVTDGMVTSVIATDQVRGIAAFQDPVFTVVDGNVTLKPATTSTLGVASFDANYFLVNDGAVTCIEDVVKNPKFVADDGQFAKVKDNQILVSGTNGIVTSIPDPVNQSDRVGFGITGDVQQYLAGNDGSVNHADSNIMQILGVGPLSTTSPKSGLLNISCALATTNSAGTAKFDPSLFTVNDGNVLINSATATALGVASFNDPGFTVSNGNVTLNFATSSAKGIAAFPTPFTVQDGVVGIQDASSSDKGIASFSDDFDITSGVVSINTLPVTKGGTGATNFKSNGAVLSSYSNSPLYASPSFDEGTFLGQGTAEIRPLYARGMEDLIVDFQDDFVYFTNPSPGFKWQGFPYSQQATTVEPGNAYTTNSGANQPITFTLSTKFPNPTANPQIKIIGGGLSPWTLDTNGYTVRFGQDIASNQIVSSTPFDSLELTYVQGFVHRYVVTSSMGNFSIS